MSKLWITIAVLLIIVLFQSWLLYKKDTTHNEIANLKQKNKRNRDSNIDNDITPHIEVKKQRKGLLKRLKTKKQKV